MISLNHYLVLSAVLFSIGTAGVFLRRNLITIMLSIEIMLNAVNITFVAVGRYLGTVDGQIITFFVMTVAAAEAAVGLALVIALFRHRETLSPDAFTSLKWGHARTDSAPSVSGLLPQRLPRQASAEERVGRRGVPCDAGRVRRLGDGGAPGARRGRAFRPADALPVDRVGRPEDSARLPRRPAV